MPSTMPSNPAEHEIKLYSSPLSTSFTSPPSRDPTTPPSTDSASPSLPPSAGSESSPPPPGSESSPPPPGSSQPEQAERPSSEEITAEQIRTRAQEFENLGLDYYAGKVVKSEGGKVWQPRFEGDQWPPEE
jgi:hypothetical protein